MPCDVLTLFLLWAKGAFASTETSSLTSKIQTARAPQGPVMIDSAGNVYGITTGGGTNGFGTVYQVVHSGGTWTLNILYDFAGGTSDVCSPNSGLVRDSSGNLYGTGDCGAYGYGGVFELSYSRGFWTVTTSL